MGTLISLGDMQSVMVLITAISTIFISIGGAWLTVKSKLIELQERQVAMDKRMDGLEDSHKEFGGDLKALVGVLNKLDVTMSTTLARMDERIKIVQESLSTG